VRRAGDLVVWAIAAAVALTGFALVAPIRLYLWRVLPWART
jgi:hypothetical protein